MAFLTTAHAQLTRGRQEVLISGPEINDSLGHVDRDIPPLITPCTGKSGMYTPTMSTPCTGKVIRMYTPTMSTVPSLATSWNLDSVGHIKVGHPHPPHRPTSCVDHVAILVAGITCGCALLQYPILFLCTPVSWYLQELVGFWNDL